MTAFSLLDDNGTVDPQFLIHSSLGVFFLDGGTQIDGSTQLVLDNTPWTDFLDRAIHSRTPLSIIARNNIKKMPRWSPQPVTIMTTPDIIENNAQWSRYRYEDDDTSTTLLKRAMNYSSSLPIESTLGERLHQSASVYRNIQRTAEQHTAGKNIRMPMNPDHIIHNMIEILDESYYLSTTAQLGRMTHEAYLYKYGRPLARVISLIRKGDPLTPVFIYPAHTLSHDSIRYHILLSAFMIDDTFGPHDTVGWGKMKQLIDHTLTPSFTAIDTAFADKIPYTIQ